MTTTVDPRRVARFVALACLVAAAPFAPAAAQSGRADVDYGLATDYYTPTNRLKVVELYHLGPCERHLNNRNFRKAVGECAYVLRVFPNHPRALNLTVKACEWWRDSRLDQRCRMDQVFERAVAINPKAPDTFTIHGIYLHGEGKYGDARRSYERALELDADSMNAHYNLGLACLELKDYACANQHAQQAYSLGAALPGLRDRLQKVGQWTGRNAEPDAEARKSVAAGTR